MPILYKIRDWDKHFENCESRRYRTVKWVPVPNKHDGKGFRRISLLPNNERVLCGWYLILELASKMPARGVLADDDGPLTPEGMALKTGFPVACFQDALEALCHPDISWIIAETSNEPAADLRQTCGNLPTIPVLNRIELNRREEKDSGGVSPSATIPIGLPNHPTIEEVLNYFAKLKTNGADYSSAEVRAAFLAMQTATIDGLWMWGKRPVTDWRAAMETKINDARDRKPGKNGGARSFPSQKAAELERSIDELTARHEIQPWTDQARAELRQLKADLDATRKEIRA